MLIIITSQFGFLTGFLIAYFYLAPKWYSLRKSKGKF